jgi:prophage DNA circulation protein
MSKNLEAAIARLEERVAHVADEVRHVHEEVSELKATANRWKGAFWVMVGVGGVVGTAANFILGWLGK